MITDNEIVDEMDDEELNEDEMDDDVDGDVGDIDPTQPHVVQLVNPVMWGKREIAELVLRPVTGADIRKLRTPRSRPLAMILELAGYLSGQPYQIIDKLQGADLGHVMEVTNFFFASSQGIGAKPSPRSE